MKNHWLNLVILMILGIITFGIGIGKRDLWAPDEPRFGQVTREMLQRGDPFVLHVNGEPYSDKPPLHIWIAALVTIAQGDDGSDISSFAVRLPSVLGGLIGLAAVYGIGCLLFGSTRPAFLSAVVLCTTLTYLWQAGRAQLDMLMAAWAFVALFAFLKAERASSRGARLGWWAAFWVSGALGTLSKGPPAIIVALGAVAFYFMALRDMRRTWRTAALWSIAIFALTLVGGFELLTGKPFLILTGLVVAGLLVQVGIDWVAPLARKNAWGLTMRLGWLLVGLMLFALVVGIWFVPYRLNAPKEASNDTLVDQTVTRYLAAESHNNPVWFYLENLPHGLMPWTFFFALAVWAAFRGDQSMAPKPRAFLLSWILFTLVFFSLSPGKRDQYLLPSYPAYALFVGWFFWRLTENASLRDRPGWRRAAWVNVFMSSCFCITALAFSAAKAAYGDQPPAWLAEQAQDWDIALTIPVWPMGILGAISALAIWWEARRRDAAALFTVLALTFTVLSFYVHNVVMPKVDPRKSGRNLTLEIAEHRHADEPVAIYDFFREDYICYADYFLHVIEEIDADQPWEETALYRYIRPENGRKIIIFRKKALRLILRDYPEAHKVLRPLFHTSVGHRDMTVADNQAGAQAPATP